MSNTLTIETPVVYELEPGEIADLAERAEDFGYDSISEEQLDAMFNHPEIASNIETAAAWIKRCDQVVELEKAAQKIHQVKVDESRDRRKAAERSGERMKMRFAGLLKTVGSKWRGKHLQAFFRAQYGHIIAGTCNCERTSHNGPHWYNDNCLEFLPSAAVPEEYKKVEVTTKTREINKMLTRVRKGDETSPANLDHWCTPTEHKVLIIQSVAQKPPKEKPVAAE